MAIDRGRHHSCAESRQRLVGTGEERSGGAYPSCGTKLSGYNRRHASAQTNGSVPPVFSTHVLRDAEMRRSMNPRAVGEVGDPETDHLETLFPRQAWHGTWEGNVAGIPFLEAVPSTRGPETLSDGFGVVSECLNRNGHLYPHPAPKLSPLTPPSPPIV